MRRATSFAVLLGLAVLSACARRGEPHAGAPRPLRLAAEHGVSTLDPTYTEGTTFSILSNLYEPLVDYDRQMRLVPALATEWSAPDEKTWILKLRRGVRLHDGSLLTPQDVAAALLRARNDPLSAVRGQLESVASVEARDDGVLRILTSRPDALLLHELTNVLVAKGESRADIDRRPLGTGPYRLTAWEKGKRVEAEAFPEHWRGPPPIQRVAFVTVAAGSSSVAALKAHRVDVVEVPARMVLDRGRGFRIADTPGLTTSYLYINSLALPGGRDNPLSDRRVRQALSLAIDRRAVARQAVGHDGAFAQQIVPASVFGYAAALPAPVFDPVAARRLLREAHRVGANLVLTHRDSLDARAVSELLRSMLESVGFRVTLRALAWEDLLRASASQSVPLYLSRWVFDNGDAGSFLRDCLRSRHAGSADGIYNAGYANPEMDRLVDASATIFEGSLRLQQFERVMSLAQEDVPLIPLFNVPDIWGVSEDLVWEPRLDGRLLACEMSFRKTP